MAQHDYVISNQGFPAFRTDLNNALSAVVSNNSGASAPSTTYVDNTTNMGHVSIFRDSTNITTLGHNSTYASYQSTNYNNGSSIIFLDSPSSTSAVEYRVKLKVDNASLQFVYGSHYSNGSQPRQSSLTCMEIGA